MDAKKLVLLCRELAENRKAEDIVILDVRELSSITDYFMICSGSSEPHLRAIAEEITTKADQDSEADLRAKDGSMASGWMVLDFFDVIVHIMRTDVREQYNLEGLWGDAPRLGHRKAPAKPRARKIQAPTVPSH